MKSLVTGVCAGLLTVSMLTVGPASASSPPDAPVPAVPPPAVPPPADPSRSVTLITGDRVTVTDGGGVAVQRGEGRDHVSFLTYRAGESSYVIPSDAVAPLAAGRLDRQLFDVARLRQFGYHDGRADLPLIVTGDSPRAAVAGAGGEVERALPAVDGLAVAVDKDHTTTFWDELTGPADELSDGVSTVWLDGLVYPQLAQSVPQVGAPAAWEAGLDGTGVTVAVLDSGIDAEHPDLAGQVVGQANFTQGAEDDRDLVGHGTHVGSIVAGTGAASGGQNRGVAPGARLLDGKVCGLTACATSWVVAGMTWAAEQGAAVANMSLGWPDNPALEQAAETLTAEHGTLFVISAGNSGEDRTIGSPGVAAAALTVGAVERDDSLAFFSSRGPLRDGTLKPDITAPGVGIVAANSQDGSFAPPGEPYAAASGTSMSAPHAAGAAAILAQQHPDWSPARLKAGLMAAAEPNPEIGVFGQGAGRLDVARAVTQAVTSDPASVSFDRPQWPHDDNPVAAETVTYHNHGDAEATLALSVAATGPDGAPAPAGMFTVSPAAVTVPAGGSAEVTLAADTSLAGDTGLFGGHLTAAGTETVVTTPFGVELEVESRDVTLVHTDRDGNPSQDHFTVLLDPESFREFGFWNRTEATVRVPVGDYALFSFFGLGEEEPAAHHTFLFQPRLSVTADRTVALDATAGEPVRVRVPDRKAVPTFVGAAAEVVTEESGFGVATSTPAGTTLYTAQIGPDQPYEGLTSSVAAEFAVPAPDGSIAASRTVYNVGWFVDDRFPTGFDRRVARRDLATIRAEYGLQVPGADRFKVAIPIHPERGTFGPAEFLPLDPPGTRTEYVNTRGVEWLPLFDEWLGGTPVIFLDGMATAYRAGRAFHERWNDPVFGPVLPDQFSGVLRIGDELIVAPALYGDAAGHRGWSPSDGGISLFRDGELISSEPFTDFLVAEVPPEPARYRVEVTAERAVDAPLSRRTSLAWEFESGHVSDEEFVQLPVSVVRFSPKLAPDQTAPAGRPFLVPVQVQLAGGAVELADLTVEVSYDDGDTWRAARVVADRYVRVHHPHGDGFVSFRATVATADGPTAEQTVIRAYRIT